MGIKFLEISLFIIYCVFRLFKKFVKEKGSFGIKGYL